MSNLFESSSQWFEFLLLRILRLDQYHIFKWVVTHRKRNTNDFVSHTDAREGWSECRRVSISWGRPGGRLGEGWVTGTKVQEQELLDLYSIVWQT